MLESSRIDYPTINPVSGEERPFWSVMIPTHNRSKYLARTMESVLEQDPGPDEMQIEVVDNGSLEGDPETVVRKIGRNRVSFYRQPSPVSMSDNWTTCVQRARGYWVHILHDDDVLLPGFYITYKQFIEEHPEVAMVFSRAISISERGEWVQIMHPAPDTTSTGVVENAAYELVKKNFICAPTAVVARQRYVEVGGFAAFLSYAPDWEMWMRMAASGPVGYIHHPYLLYRIHRDSDTSRIAATAKNMEEIVGTLQVGISRLPAKLRRGARVEAHRHYAAYSNELRRQLHAEGQHWSALLHASVAFRLHPSLRNLLRLMRSVFILARRGKFERTKAIYGLLHFRTGMKCRRK